MEQDEDESLVPTDPKAESMGQQERGTGKLKPVRPSKRPQQSKSKPSASPRKPPAKHDSTKEPAKASGKTIYSFFNAATSRQQSSQHSANPVKASNVTQELEVIHDDIDADRDTSQTAMSRGSSTALAMRKRKLQPSHSFEDAFQFQDLPGSQKFRKTSGGDRTPSFQVANDDKRPWTDQFAPVDVGELAVHKRKVADVKQWLQSTLLGRRQKVLILKGAAGTGKTTTLSLLAQDLGIELVEWRDTTTTTYGSENGGSTAAGFEEFVGRAGRLTGLSLSTSIDDNVSPSTPPIQTANEEADNRLQALFIEEFPNTFSRTSTTLQSFRSTIAQYLSSPVPHHAKPTPIIMVISETLLSTNTAAADSFTAHRLLGPELITNPFVNVIEFNSVAPTFLTKALELIVLKEARKSGRRKTPGPLVLKQLAETGDIRSAVSSLEFLCLRGDEGDTWSSKVAFTKPKQAKSQPSLTKAEEEALKLISNRESTLGIFHSVGKVVYNKRLDSFDPSSLAQPPAWLPQHQRTKIPETDVESLLDELGTDVSTFVAALHENVVLSCSSSSAEATLDSLSSCLDHISDADILSLDRFSFGTRAFSGTTTDSLRQDEMCAQVAVRGLLFSLPHPVRRSVPSNGKQADAFRMFYPSSLKLWRKREEVSGMLDLVITKLQGPEVQNAYKFVSGTGIESWKRNKSLEDHLPVSNSGSAGDFVRAGTEQKLEMLVDRLPYLARIKGAGTSTTFPQKLVNDIRSITHVAGVAPVPEDDNLDADDEADATSFTEQWATDRSETEAGPRQSSFGLAKNRRKDQPTLQTKGLGLPVENRVERLVLEDDDIVDD